MSHTDGNDMIKNSSKPSDGHSESPSSRPMTLRQQLVACFYDELMSEPSENDIELFDTQAVIDKLEILCQEIAREARLDELKACLANVPMPTLSYEQVEGRIKQLNGLDKYGDVVEGELPIWKVSRKAELTHKPQGDSRE